MNNFLLIIKVRLLSNIHSVCIKLVFFPMLIGPMATHTPQRFEELHLAFIPE